MLPFVTRRGEGQADARPQASKNRRRIRRVTLRIFRGREQSRCLDIVRRSRKGQSRTGSQQGIFTAGSHSTGGITGGRMYRLEGSWDPDRSLNRRSARHPGESLSGGTKPLPGT